MKKTCIIIAGGKSIREEWLNNGLFDHLRGKEIWALNYAYKTMPYLPSRELWVDESFFTNEKENLLLLGIKGVQLISQPSSLAGKGNKGKIKDYFDIIKLYNKTRDFTDQLKYEESIYTGLYSLVGLFALSVAIKEKYERIFLLGLDFGTPNIKDKDTHYYDGFISHKSRGAGDPKIYRNSNNILNEKIKDFKVYENTEAEIYNVSLRSNIDYFDKISYEEMYNLL